METKKKYSHCWWFDSYNSDKCSPWLESTLSELNEKTNSMLKLIEEDADSFAQRAEMYYKKRPELISMVEEFYRAHRSLAERHDLLKSDRASRRSPFRNPLSLPNEGYECVYDSGNSVKSFDSFTEAAYSSEEAAESEIDDPELEGDGVLLDQKTEKAFVGGATYDELMKLRDELDLLREENGNQKSIINQKDEEKEEVVKLLSDNIRELKELREGMAAVRDCNSLLTMQQTSEVLVPFVEVTNLKDEQEIVQVENMLRSKVKKMDEYYMTKLKNKMEGLKVEDIIQKEWVKKKENEVIEVTRKFEEAKSELMKLEQEAQAEKRCLKDALARKEEENVEVTRQFEEMKFELAKLRDEITENGRRKDEEKHRAIRQLKFALTEKDTKNREAIRQLNDTLVEKDREKNEAIRLLKNALAEKDEQKREAIRQLCVALEILREECKLLKKSLVTISPKKNVTVHLAKLFNISSSSQISVGPL